MERAPRDAAREAAPARAPRVFVQLAYGFDARQWRRNWESGRLVGLNEQTPYCYGRAEALGVEVQFSRDTAEGRLGRLFRIGLRAVLGFDFLHAYRNRAAIADADVVWTHTESQFLAVALLKRFGKTSQARPKLLGQSVWLFDRWKRLSPPKRAFYRWLIERVDVLTVHSPENYDIARSLFPSKWIEIVLFGVPEHDTVPPRLRRAATVKVLAVGNDEHRDWACAVAALRNEPGVELRIVSGRANPKLADAPNIAVGPIRNNAELVEAFDEATLMLVPLKENRHASGITVVQEAAVKGLPVIVTDTGGLRAYFDGDAVSYVPAGDAKAILAAVRSLAADPQAALDQARRAQARMRLGDLGGDAYVGRHVELTRQLLQV